MYKQKLIDLLKYDAKTKEAIEELELGCKLRLKWDHNSLYVITERWQNYIYINHYSEPHKNERRELIDVWEIIWLPLQERFIRMYCKWKYICFHWEKELNIWIYQIQLDNTKDFDNQTEETYMDIFNALIDIK